MQQGKNCEEKNDLPIEGNNRESKRMKRNYNAVVFDMDGVIFDSERAVMNCWLELAEKYGCKISHIAVAWEWKKGVAAPIVGATKSKYLDDAAGALDIALTDEDMAYLEELYVPHPIVGAIDKNPPQGTILVDEKK